MGVRFDQVTKRFGETIALRDFTLTIEDGEFVVLLGPSGCGKTTALRILAGLEEPTQGEVYIDEALVTDVPPKNRDIAMVFQSYALYPHMSVYDNVAFGLRMRKLPRREVDRVVRETAELLGLSDLLKRRPGQLSGGQRQRVALGRAIVRRPKAFLMDEPLSNLDAKLRAQTRLELIRLHRRLQTTVVYVTHDQVEAMTMGRRIAVLNEGVLQQVGPPQEVYERPANTFVAEFIGSPAMPFFSGEVKEADGALVLQTPGIAFRLIGQHADAVRRQDVTEVTVGVRPNHIQLAELYGDRPSAATFDADVDVVESLGSEVHATVFVEDRPIGVSLPAKDAPQPGETRRLAVAPEHLHLFDTGTGRRLE